MLRPISFSKRSYCFTNVWRRCHIAQIAVRQNHSATRVSTASESNEGLILHDSYNPLWNSTSPLKEMVSFDDFGALTVQKLLNDNREQELPLHEFLDQLLRPVPTIAETLEMGGALELNDSERDNLETALAEGYDVSALLGQLESRDPILLVQAPKRKPDLGPPTVATASVVSSAAVASEMIPQTRTVSAGTPPTILPDIPSTSYQLSSPSSKPARETPQIDTVQLILNAVDAQNMEALSNIVSTEPWPRANQLGKRTREVILFVLENSSSAQAAFEHLKAFIETNPRHFLDHDLLLALATRAILDNGVISSIDVLQKTKDLCLSRMNSRNVSSRRYYQVFSAAIVKEGVRGSVKLFEALSRLNLLKNRNAYRSWIQAAFNETNSKTLANDVSNWMIITSSLRSTDGIDLLLDRILQSNECGPDLIARFLHHCQRIEHSSATLSELVCALVRNQHFDEAKMVFSKIYLVEKFLHVPLKRFVANNDITSVETMADLVSTFVFDEKKIGGKKKNEINDQPKSVLNMVLSKEMDKFVGSQSSKNTRNRKTKIIKRHRQDEGQLYELVVCLRDVWAKLATHEQSQAKLHSWCERNGVEKP